MRRIYRSAAYASLALGAIGIVAPLLPTTPFVILAAWCFARSDPHLAEKLYAHPKFGPYLRNWRDEGAIPLRAKAIAIVAMAISFAISIAVIPFTWAPFVLGPIMAAVAIWIATRPSPRPTLPDQPPD
ncbi:MAG: DUF454 domain-containing protein [Salinarimonadaceae bacterium]|nr:MAG: DUF454 domain-containing protein [Salinarimonadaceae bacterium]